MFMHDLAIP